MSLASLCCLSVAVCTYNVAVSAILATLQGLVGLAILKICQIICCPASPVLIISGSSG